MFSIPWTSELRDRLPAEPDMTRLGGYEGQRSQSLAGLHVGKGRDSRAPCEARSSADGHILRECRPLTASALKKAL